MKYRIRKQNYMLQGFIGWDLPIPFYNTMRVGVTVLLYWLPCAPSTTIFPSIVLILCYRAKMFLVDN